MGKVALRAGNLGSGGDRTIPASSGRGSVLMLELKLDHGYPLRVFL